MRYSFIIPILNDLRVLDAIDSFHKAKHSSDNECLVICNGTEQTLVRKIVDRYKNFPNIKVVFTSRGNISLARNIGVLLARGEYLVFVDADCTFDDVYISTLLKVHKDQDVIRGKINYERGKTNFDIIYAWLRTYFGETTESWYTPNLVVRKALYVTVGLYNETQSGSEDTDWSQRLINLGRYKAEYVPELVITHGLDNPKKASKTWVSYGLGQSYRARKAILFYGQSVRMSFLGPFREFSLLNIHNGFRKNLFILNYVWFKSLGFFYGWFFKWSMYDKEKYLEVERYYSSEEYKAELLKKIEHAN